MYLISCTIVKCTVDIVGETKRTNYNRPKGANIFVRKNLKLSYRELNFLVVKANLVALKRTLKSTSIVLTMKKDFVSKVRVRNSGAS